MYFYKNFKLDVYLYDTILLRYLSPLILNSNAVIRKAKSATGHNRN